ncbi:MAG: Phosphodiesterase YfcE [Firmicutes bacterium ADurb.BinA205]|nr:MAG: Phosphodiesterase YfcE [Firmicutes bacterium ADurb.BinA205]HOC34138.1 metallophosphoesterase [Ruminococcus flavefaciens]HQM00378.1 metallophosphoesterase [Ruminococcus flavefaciens]
MRVIVISDTHGNYPALEKVFMRNTDADWLIHLGDGERELDRFVVSHPELSQKIIHVAGNCDYNSLSPEHFILPLPGGHRILATHGHLYGVNSSRERLKMLARANKCDIILFGHTHERFECTENGFKIMNPGSASCPRDGRPPSFGHIDISPAGIVLNIVSI